MSMVKVIAPGSQEFSEPVCSLIKTSSRGLLGSDKDLLVKRAGAQIAHEISHIKSAEDEPLIHMLAIGATEAYSMNRNGDGFTVATCRRNHPTFVKHARFFRDHGNKNPEKSYGRVKLSFYNEPMKRIELVVALNSSPEAARRNGGLVADRELEKLASGKEIPTSMACRIPRDFCSYCHNGAATRAEYCDSPEYGGHCKAGGLKRNIGALVDIDGGLHPLHADNPDPTFFDISHVFRPADRIAYVTGMLKSAGHEKISGAQLAEALGVTIPYELLVSQSYPADVQRMLKLAYRLSDLEQGLARLEFPLPENTALAFQGEAAPDGFYSSPPPLAREKFANTLRALASAKVCLPPTQFLMFTTGQSPEKAASVAACLQADLPGVFSRMLSRPGFEEQIASNPYVPGPASSPGNRYWAEKQASYYSLATRYVTQRVTQAAIHGRTARFSPVTEKHAAASTPSQRLAEQYALYQLGFLSAIPPGFTYDAERLSAMVVLQNHAAG